MGISGTRRKQTIGCETEKVNNTMAREFSKICKGGRTHQSFKDECDITTIMRNWERSGVDPRHEYPAQYGDFSNANDYQAVMDRIAAAKNAFMELDPHLRARFDNDPAKLLEFIADERNADELVELGLVPNPTDENAESKRRPETPEASRPQPAQGTPGGEPVADGTVQGGE